MPRPAQYLHLATAALRETATKKRKLVERDIVARVVEADARESS